uniref:Uncharacterized protein n=1 Tax=Acanthochromis polyacanthus TaxID=80966 RepID=A0A3Q1FQJ3_9TELE
LLVMMTSVRMWCLLFAAFMPIVPTVTEVVDSVSQCAEFLLNKSPPQIPGILQRGNILNQNRYKVICQTFMNQRRFLTLYDTENKIPVFSAYKYKELEDIDINMRDDEYTKQAGNKDYTTDKPYNRGHLFPACHAFDSNDRKSTFTLTNIVPQAVSFNGGSWQKMESCTQCILQKYCINEIGIFEGFVVTGAQPSTSNKLNNRVNIPSMLWTAFCCNIKNTDRWIASAHWGDNIAEPKSKYLQTKTLAELHQELSKENSMFEDRLKLSNLY